MTNVVRLGGPLAVALLGVAAWSSCVDMSGSRTDVPPAGDDAGATGDDGGGMPSGSSSGGGSSSSGGSVTPPTPDLCGFPVTDAASPVLYGGAPVGTTCVTGIPSPRNGTWFPYHDSSGDGGLIVVDMAARGGCGGASPCALHAYGPVPDAGGFLSYAGVGFDLFDVSNVATSYDVTTPNHYTGIQFWAKGTLTGTRGTGYSSSPQTIHLKLITATYRGGDDYGVYCPMIDPTVWTMCRLDFAAAKRDGFYTTVNPTTDTFDGNQLQKIQFEASTYNGPPPAAAAFDVWIDEVSFY